MIPAAILSALDAGRPFILDGGLGSELDARGYDISSPLWSAELILRQPQALLDIHHAYLEAGAQCITSASYQASIPGLAARGFDDSEIEQVFVKSVDLACAARDRYLQSDPGVTYRPLVAASVGPYGAYLADGSEYRGRYGIEDKRLSEFHRQRLQWLDRSDADLIACETIPDLQEARVLAGLLESIETPAWISFCCRDEHSLQDGQPIDAALEIFADHPVFALGVNCCATQLMLPLIKKIRARIPGKLIVVYPNSGQQYDAASRSWHGGESLLQWSEQAREWYRAGAGLIGGCCRIGPEYIHQLAAIKTWRY